MRENPTKFGGKIAFVFFKGEIEYFNVPEIFKLFRIEKNWRKYRPCVFFL